MRKTVVLIEVDGDVFIMYHNYVRLGISFIRAI